MNRLLFTALLLIGLLTSCSRNEVTISGRIVGTAGKMVYLEKSATLDQSIVDSVKMDAAGNFELILSDAPTTPSLYHIIHEGQRIPLLLTAGEQLEINAAGNITHTYEVLGSAESELLRQFNKEYMAGAAQLTQLAAQYAASADEQTQAALNKEYATVYTKTNQMQLRFINEHKSNIAAVYALYQRLPNDIYLFKGDSDIIYYKTVADAISKSYPNSPYLSILRSQIARMDAQLSLISQITETSIPELVIPDMYGNDVALSSLQGKVILLQFWSAELGNSNALNADLKQIYSQYHDKGFEIYQVAIDTSRATWINSVQEQGLPWISVCDLMGQHSSALSIYNVQTLPYNYLFDAEGNILGKQLTTEQLAEKLQTIF